MYSESDAIGCEMLLRTSSDFSLENPRRYPESVTEKLRRLLIAGGEVQEDPRRPNFCEIEDDGCSYYIYVSPISGRITLLAQWSRVAARCHDEAGQAA